MDENKHLTMASCFLVAYVCRYLKQIRRKWIIEFREQEWWGVQMDVLTWMKVVGL